MIHYIYLFIVMLSLNTQAFSFSNMNDFPPGDMICDAIALVVNAPPVTSDNTNATSEPNEPIPACWDSTSTLNSIWFSFTAPQSGKVTVSTNFLGTSLSNSHLAIYDVDDCNNIDNLVEIACDEDGGDLQTASIETSGLSSGETYFIQVDGYADETGAFKVEVFEAPTCTTLTTPQDSATNISVTAPLYWSATSAVDSFIISIGSFPGATDIINNQDLKNATSFTYPLKWAYNTPYFVTLIAYNSHALKMCEETYFITEFRPGDLLCDALPLTLNVLPIIGDITNATGEIDEPVGSCWQLPYPIRSVWYQFTAPSSGIVQATTSFDFGSLSDAHLAIYEIPSCDSFNTAIELACDEDGGDIGFSSTVQAENLIPSNSYFIQIDGVSDEMGTFELQAVELAGCTTLQSPSNGDANVATSEPLTWPTVNGATNYILSVGTSPNSSDVIDHLSLGDTSTFQNSIFWEHNTTFYVSIEVDNGNGISKNCQTSSFTTIPMPLANNGPGGIIPHNILWVKANDGVYSSNSNVLQWIDFSSGGNNATQPDASFQPSQQYNKHNYNPSLYFDGTNKHLEINNLFADSSKTMSIIAVGTNETGGDLKHSMVFGQANSSWQDGGYGLGTFDGSLGFWVYDQTIAASAPINSNLSILGAVFDSTSLHLSQDAHLANSFAYTGIVGDNGSSYIGGGASTDNSHKGYISEIAIFDTTLTATESNLIHSYLGIKYGITLDRLDSGGDYTNSSGISIFSDDGIDTYWNDIIGIGRDDLSQLQQKQSHLKNDSLRLYIGTLAYDNISNNATFSLDPQFIVVGSDLGAAFPTALQMNDRPANIFRLVDKEWKISNTNFNSTFSIDIQVDDCSFTKSITSNDIRLLVSSDSDFTNAAIVDNSNVTISLSDNFISFKDIPTSVFTTNSTAFFTIGTTVDPLAPFQYSQTICSGTDITINGTVYNESNSSGLDTLTTSNGCDSIISIQINFLDAINTNFDTTLCFGENYTINSTTYDANNPSGIETFTSYMGCDSLVHVQLNILDLIETNFDTTLCFGESYTINSATYDANNPSGTETFTSFTGCDSLVHVQLNFLDLIETNFDTTLCFGENYTINSATYDANNPSGTETFTSFTGCDSLVHVQLNFLDLIETNFDTTICDGANITIGTTNYSAINPTGTETFSSYMGCDSLVYVTVSFLAPIQTNFNQTLCSDQEMTINGITYDIDNPSGIQTLTAENGCDSILNINLNFIPPIETNFAQSLCTGQSMVINDSTYDANHPSGTQVLLSYMGCDSTVNINLSFMDSIQTDYTQTLCEGQSIVINGTLYDANNPSGTQSLTANSGCDSIVHISIDFLAPALENYEPTICTGQSIVVNGILYDANTSSGTQNLTTVAGCDSILTVNLNFSPPVTEDYTPILCTGQSIFINGTLYDANTPTGTQTLSTAEGCDSIVNINLVFLDPIQTNFSPTLCNGQTMTINGTEYSESHPNGVEHLTAYNGCDSVVNISLTFLSTLNADYNETFCADQSIVVNTTTYNINNPSGTEMLTAFSGCDSIVHINLSFYDDIITNYSPTLCFGESDTINGIAYDSSNPTGTDTLTAYTGCDSIVNISLSFLDPISDVYSPTLCFGESETINGIIFNSDNPTGVVILTSYMGCDSTINISLSFLDEIKSDFHPTVCHGGTYSFNGIAYNAENPTGTSTLISYTGCDSIVYVAINELDEITNDYNEVLCTNQSQIINGTLYDVNHPSGIETFQSYFGCDSIVNINFNVQPVFDTIYEASLCLGDSLFVNGTIYDENNLSGSEKLTSQYGCDSFVEIYLSYLSEIPIIADDYFLVDATETYDENIFSNDSLIPTNWSLEIVETDHDNWFDLPHDGRLVIRSNKAEDGDSLTIIYEVCNDGCVNLCDTATIGIKYFVPKDPNEAIASDILTLNGDGKNDFLFFKFDNISTNEGIRIYNRWGDLVFAQKPYKNNWKGTNQQGKALPDGTYYYILNLKQSEGNTLKGDVLLMH